MATKNIVPRADSEGSLGKTTKKWESAYIDTIYCDSFLTTSSGTIPEELVAKTADYTATVTDTVILCDASGGDITITLPTAVGATGRVYIIKKTDDYDNSVSVDGDGSETIDGLTSIDLISQYATLAVISNGTNWSILYSL